jgi:hypothetical protein
MADRELESRVGAGAALDIAQHDQNLNGLASTTEEQTGATYEVVYTDYGKLIELNNASMVCTLDAIADIVADSDTGVDNFKVTLKNTNTADATINRSSTDTFDGKTSLTLAENNAITLQTNAAGDTWLIKNEKVTVYGGIVHSTNPAALSTLPGGWSASSTGTGIYTITHNLGISGYGVVVSAGQLTSPIYVAGVSSHDNNEFTARVFRISTEALTDVGFDFCLIIAN